MVKTAIIISDTHGSLSSNDNFWEAMDNADYIIHLGDGKGEVTTLKDIYKDKVISIGGNCDYSDEDFKIININNVRILIAHGHKLGVKSNLLNITYACLENNCEVGLFGHTHQPIEIEDRVILINPGSLTYTNTYCYLAVMDNKKVIHKIVNLY